MDLDAHERLLAMLKAKSADVSMDGPVVASRYENSKVRMMWVLRGVRSAPTENLQGPETLTRKFR